MNKKLGMIGAACLFAAAGTTTVLTYRAKGDAAPSTSRRTEAKRVAGLVDKGRTPGWTGADNTRAASILPNQPVSNADFQWALQKLDLRKADPNSQVGIVTMTISALKEAKLSSSQKASFISAALPLLSMNDPVYNDGDIEEYACKVFIKYPDRRAIPQLHVLASSPHPWVRRDAARALAASGENVAIPARPTTW